MNDWLAVHVVDFFNRINLIYGTVAEFCTESSCPKMSGGSRYEYFWQDGDKFKKPTPLPASQYIENLMDWVEGQINNDDIFPTTSNVPFPKSFSTLSKKILTRLFRVFVHVYIHHFDRWGIFYFEIFYGSFVDDSRPLMRNFLSLSKIIKVSHFYSYRIVSIGAEPHVNTCFKHFHYFVTEFDLIAIKEMEPLAELVQQICKDWDEEKPT